MARPERTISSPTVAKATVGTVANRLPCLTALSCMPVVNTDKGLSSASRTSVAIVTAGTGPSSLIVTVVSDASTVVNVGGVLESCSA